VLRVAQCVLRAARCVLRVACCTIAAMCVVPMLVACCAMRVACCANRVAPMLDACCGLRNACCVLCASRCVCCVLRNACCVLRNRLNACCANACCVYRVAQCVLRAARCVLRVAFSAIAAMRVAPMLVAAFSLFFLKRKDTEGSRENGSDAGGTCRSVRREGKKGGGEERKGNGKRAAGALTYLRGQRRWPARCARARRAALCRERAASSVKHVNHRFRCALAFYRPRASPISRQQSCCAAYLFLLVQL